MKKRTFILFYFYPAIVSFFITILFKSSYRYADLIENSLFSFLFLLLSILIINRKFKSIFLYSGFVLLTIIFFFETAYFYLYGYSISESTIYILLETYRAEASEYLSVFVDRFIILLTLIFFIPIIFFPRFISGSINNQVNNLNIKIGFKFIAIPALMIAIMAIISFTGLQYYSLPLTTVKSLIEYKNTVSKLDLLILNKTGGNFSNVRQLNSSEKITYILVIGESMTRNHFNLYGYYRQTNPLLNQIKDELYIYNEVIAPHTTTIQVLLKALTPGNYENPAKSTTGTLLQLMNKAGFKTYWISNQKPSGTNESISSKLSKTADKRIFLTDNSINKTPPFDEKLLESLQEILKENVDKKMIIIHMLGAHSDYSKRYPEEYDYFKETPKTVFKNDIAFRTINEYDNAVLYSDFVIRNIIEIVRNKSAKSYVLYFSDHGEDVFDTKNVAWHTETEGTKPMYDVPFILWLSETYKSDISENIVFDVNRKYMTDDLIFSIACLSYVWYGEYMPERSVFDKKFKFRKRKIYHNLDYDLLFLN